ncbi:hypothetical protein SLUN_08340 [Streptomyces lunaelactis]|uniref:Uncharacterized protein n=1 Tax=Streptomyces lunaelactis TaxID=1535768 RepID=A0A2R4SZA0_9ACTN|nr:hypothetical protein SLUN_08340 [Streptomyces lunaelactis]
MRGAVEERPQIPDAGLHGVTAVHALLAEQHIPVALGQFDGAGQYGARRAVPQRGQRQPHLVRRVLAGARLQHQHRVRRSGHRQVEGDAACRVRDAVGPWCPLLDG